MVDEQMVDEQMVDEQMVECQMAVALVENKQIARVVSSGLRNKILLGFQKREQQK